MTQDANDIARQHGADGLRAVFDTSVVDMPEETETPEPEPPRFLLIPFNEISLPTAVDYAVKGILPGTGVVAVWGPYSCGKSFWTLNLVLHMSLGWASRVRRGKPGDHGVGVEVIEPQPQYRVESTPRPLDSRSRRVRERAEDTLDQRREAFGYDVLGVHERPPAVWGPVIEQEP